MTAPTPSNMLGKYQILEKIGQGAFAQVFKALDTDLQRIVALKVLHTNLLADRAFVDGFIREAKTAANLSGPHLVHVYDVGEIKGFYYLAMQYMAGGTLAQRLEREKRIPWQEAIEIVAQIADALDTVHRANLVHQDIKPSNILFDDQGQAYLGDFGIARAAESSTTQTASRNASGTAAYYSPEQGRGQQMTRRSDIYSLGVVAYEMLTGQKPFSSINMAGYVYAHNFEQPPLPAQFNAQISQAVQDALLKALEKDPAQRYPSAKTFAAALQQAAQQPFRPAVTQRPAAAAPTPPPATDAASPRPAVHPPAPQRTVSQPARRSWLTCALGVLLALCILAFGGYLVYTNLDRLFPQLVSFLPTSPVAQPGEPGQPTANPPPSSAPTSTDTPISPVPPTANNPAFTPTSLTGASPTHWPTNTPTSSATPGSSGNLPPGAWVVRSWCIEHCHPSIIFVNQQFAAISLERDTDSDWTDIVRYLIPGQDNIVAFASQRDGWDTSWYFGLRSNDVTVWGAERPEGRDGSLAYRLDFVQQVVIHLDGSVENLRPDAIEHKSPPGLWYVRAQDMDTVGAILVNGQPVAITWGGFSDGWVDITKWLYAEQDNVIRVYAWSRNQDAKWDFAIKQNDIIVWALSDKAIGSKPGFIMNAQAIITGSGEVRK